MMLLSEIPPLGGPDPGWAGERLEGYVKTSLAKNRSYFGDGSLHWAKGLISSSSRSDHRAEVASARAGHKSQRINRHTPLLPVTLTGLLLGAPETPSCNKTVIQRQRLLVSSGSGNPGTAPCLAWGLNKTKREVMHQDGRRKPWVRRVLPSEPGPCTASFLPDLLSVLEVL